MAPPAESATPKVDRYKALGYELPTRTLVWQLTGKGLENFHLEEIDLPPIGPRDIRFRSDSNGICFSDVKVVVAGQDHPRLADYDMAKDKVVPGHEISITIVEVGDEAKGRFKIGERYIVQADMLEFDTAVGYAIWGGMIQYGVFDERVQNYLIKIEDDIAYSQASLVEPWACIEASYERADLQTGDRVAWVLGGGGPMGQMHLIRTITLKEHGKLPTLEAIVVSDVSEERLAAVEARYGERTNAAGARLVCLDPRAADFGERMEELAPGGVDYVIACAQIPAVVNDSRRYLKRYGVLNLFAGLKRGEGELNLGDIHYDQHTITGNSGSRLQDMEKVLRKTEQDEMDTNDSAGAVVGMKACNEGIRAVQEGTITNKTVLYPQLPNLPLTRIEELPSIVRFSPAVEAEVRKGYWSRAAENEMLEQMLEI